MKKTYQLLAVAGLIIAGNVNVYAEVSPELVGVAERELASKTPREILNEMKDGKSELANKAGCQAIEAVAMSQGVPPNSLLKNYCEKNIGYVIKYTTRGVEEVVKHTPGIVKKGYEETKKGVEDGYKETKKFFDSIF